MKKLSSLKTQMKSPDKSLNQLSRKTQILIWVIFHVSLFGLFFSLGEAKVETSLTSILPSSSREFTEVESRLQEGFGASITILVGDPEFEVVRSLSEALAQEIRGVAGIRSVSLKQEVGESDEVFDFLYDYRYQILAPTTRDLLQKGDIGGLERRAFRAINTPLGMNTLSRLNLDPYLFTNERVRYLLTLPFWQSSSGAMRRKEGVLSREFEGKWWVLLTVASDPEQASSNIDVETNPVAQIIELCGEVLRGDPEAEILYTGVPVHSYLSSLNSQREITLISSLSTLFVILLILAVFRGLSPLLFTLFTIGVAGLTGAVVTLLFFQEIHIFTIVLGTSLIGISVDYSFHYFTSWFSLPPLSSSTPSTPTLESISSRRRRVIRVVLPGISMGFLTTVLSYIAFFFTRVPLLQQVALFSMAGLLSTFLSVSLLSFHRKRVSQRSQESCFRIIGYLTSLRISLREVPKGVKITLLVLILGGAGLALSQTSISRNIQDLYSPSPALITGERRIQEITQFSPPHFLVIRGDNLEEVLQREERFLERIDGVDGVERGGVLGLTLFLPSQKRQRENYDLVGERILPVVDEQLDFLGSPAGSLERWNFDFTQNADRLLTWDTLPEDLPYKEILGELNLGEIGGRYYNVMLVPASSVTPSLQEVVERDENLFFMSSAAELGTAVYQISWLVIKLLFLSYAVIWLLLTVRYRWKLGLLVVMIPLLATLLTLTLLIVFKQPITLFVIVGLILVLGMGSDYVILLLEGKEESDSVWLAITMSMLTTSLTFGLLGFSQIARIFGLTIGIGIFLTYFLTLLYHPDDPPSQDSL